MVAQALAVVDVSISILAKPVDREADLGEEGFRY